MLILSSLNGRPPAVLAASWLAQHGDLQHVDASIAGDSVSAYTCLAGQRVTCQAWHVVNATHGLVSSTLWCPHFMPCTYLCKPLLLSEKLE